jgi:hypothetical protein
MANIGSEVERALNWRTKNNQAYSQKAYERALDLLDMTLDSVERGSHLKELARVREMIVDYFSGVNIYSSSDSSWKKYFSYFTYAARRNH